MDTCHPDAYTPYENGVRQFLNHMEPQHHSYQEVQRYQGRLAENLYLSRHYGDNEKRRAERTWIIEQLNDLSLLVLNTPFDRLCSSISPGKLDDQPEAHSKAPLKPRNPFSLWGRITSPEDFFDREELLHQIFERLERGENLALVGEEQIGKSSLLSMICSIGPQRMKLPLDTFAYVTMQRVRQEDDFYETVCEKLGIETRRGHTLMRAMRNARHILCLDDINHIATMSFAKKIHNLLFSLARGASASLKLVVTSHSPLADVFPDTTHSTISLVNLCHHIIVEPFSEATTHAFLQQRLDGTGITFTEQQIAALHAESKGNPGTLQRAAALLYRRIALTGVGETGN